MKTVYVILGSARSGSTVLAKALGGHSKCFAIGEINRLNQELADSDTVCGCAEDLNKCTFWKSVINELDSTGDMNSFGERYQVGIFDEVSKSNGVFKLLNTVVWGNPYKNQIVENQICNTLKLYKALFKTSDSSVLIDSSKGLFRALILASRSEKTTQFRFIHLIRDGRAVLNSNLKTKVSLVDKTGKVREYEGKNKIKDPKVIFNKWMYINLRNLLVLKLFFRKKSILVKYEDFISYPKETLEKILKTSNLDFEKDMILLDKDENHILGGNASRVNAKRIKPKNDLWKDALDEEVLNMTNRKGGWFLKIMGY